MIKRTGDMFTTTAKHIGHGCNAKGLMGAGVAKTVRDRYPEVYEKYTLELKYARLVRTSPLGRDIPAAANDGRVIHNLITQDAPGANAEYALVFQALMDCAKEAGDVTIAIPLIGCGIGGLYFDDVEHLINAVEVLNPGVEFEVWKL